MKHFFALLLSVLMVLSLLTACGDKTTPSDGDDQTVTDENGSDTDNNTDDTTDPYDAVRSYWSEDQLTQAWGPDQVVEHLFFHPIIAYPQWAFHDCNASQDQRYGLDDWMVTVDEYNKILQSVYDKGYILVAMEDVWSEVTDETGTHMVRNTLMLPEGKKPLVISFDDVNYYPYMLDEGFTSKLVVGDDGEIWAQCTDPYTNETFLTKELDATPILDQFVYEHPDFSLNGAKAIFSLTGYQGILGYRTQDDRDIAADSPDRPAFDAYRASEIEAVKRTVRQRTAWRLDGTLREFPKFDPKNLWFRYPVHVEDTVGVLKDLQAESEMSPHQRGAKRGGEGKRRTEKAKNADKRAELLNTFDACNIDGQVTVKDMAEYLGVEEKTIRNRIKRCDDFTVENSIITKKKAE